MENVKYVILFSGKRKTGKDYLTEKLNRRLQPNSQIIRISEPIKSEWAKKLNLNLDELLSDGPYKEKYRKDMIEWSDEVRQQDYGFFCRAAVQSVSKDIVIVSDVRRQNDIKYFKNTFGDRLRTVRLVCTDDVRASRGWRFQLGVDDVQSECDLDDYGQWDLVIDNGSNSDLKVEEFYEQIEKLLQ